MRHRYIARYAVGDVMAALVDMIPFAQGIGRLHAGLANACAVRAWTAVGIRVARQGPPPKHRRRTPEDFALIPDPKEYPEAWKGGLLRRLHVEWLRLDGLIKIAQEIAHATDDSPDVDLQAIRATLADLREHYGPLHFGYVIDLPSSGEPSLVFSRVVPPKMPEEFERALAEADAHFGALYKLRHQLACTHHGTARRMLSPTEWSIWQAIPGQDERPATTDSIALKVGVTSKAVEEAFGRLFRPPNALGAR